MRDPKQEPDPSEARPAPERGLISYLRRSTNLFNSLVFIAPVFVFYQVGVVLQLAAEAGGRYAINGADYLTRLLLLLCGGTTWLYVLLVLVIAVGYGLGLRYLGRRDGLDVRVFPGMLAESVVYALIFALTIHGFQTGEPLRIGTLSAPGPQTTWEMLFQAFGAGFNEELIFRLGLLGGIVVLGRASKLPEAVVLSAAFVGSSLAFSAFHYAGPYADVFIFDSFMYRTLAGILLATVYWFRGLGVAVYTHALFDLYFFVLWE